MANKIFKHYTGTLEAFKQYVASKTSAEKTELFGDSITFIHPDDSSNSGWLYANEEYYTAQEMTGLTPESLKDVLDGDSIGVEISNGKLKLTPLLQANVTSNLQTAVGYIPTGTQTDIFTAGMSLDDIIKKIFCKVLDYTTSITDNFALTGAQTVVEVGSTYIPTISFTGAPTIKYVKPTGGSNAQVTKTLTASNYTLTYAFGETANPSSFGSTNQYAPSWTVTESDKTYYGAAKVSNIASASSLGLKKSDDKTASTATIADKTTLKNITVKGAYKVYYVVNSTVALTSSSTFTQCTAALTQNAMLTNNVTVLDSVTEIGTSLTRKYVYVLIPASKATPTFQNELGIQGEMTVINSSLTNSYGTTYKLCALGAEGQAGVKYQNLVIKK